MARRSPLVEEGRKEGTDLFNDAYYTFLFTVIWRRTYGKGKPLLSLHELLFPISSMGSFICTIPPHWWNHPADVCPI